jgi:hemolysin III
LLKPKLRGSLHQYFFFISLGACALLLAKSSSSKSLTATLVYSFGLLSMFGVSALYHKLHWNPKPRALMKRLDHSAIFLLIAGTFTPVCLFALSPESSQKMILIIWSVAIVGILQSIFWVKAPKWFTAIFYILMGWMIIPFLPELQNTLGSFSLTWLAAGGVAYTVGAVFYAIKKPNLFPNVFGYHELFHLFTIFGAILHFVVVYQLIH